MSQHNFHDQFFVVCNIFQSHHPFKIFNYFVLAKKGKCWWTETRWFLTPVKVANQLHLDLPALTKHFSRKFFSRAVAASIKSAFVWKELPLLLFISERVLLMLECLKEERHKIDKFPMTIYVPWPMTSNIECHDDMMDHHWWLVSVFRFCFSCCCCFWSRAKKERGPFWKAGHRPTCSVSIQCCSGIRYL